MKASSENIVALVHSLTHSDKRVVRAAVDALVGLGHESAEVAAALNKLFRRLERKKRWPPAYALAQLGVLSLPGLEVLMEALGSEDADVRWATVVVLSRLGRNDSRVFKGLDEVLRTGNSLQRRMAVYCLRDLDLKPEVVEGLVHQVVQDSDPMVRVAGVNALMKQLPHSRGTLTVLRRVLLRDSDARVRNSARFALKRQGS